MHQHNKLVIRTIMWTAALLCHILALSSQPVQAIVQPRVYDWQMRLTKAIPLSTREQAAEKALELGSGASAEQIQLAAAEIPSAFSRPALELFLAIKVLLAQDRALQTQERHLLQIKQAIGVCQKYLRRLDRHKPGSVPAQSVPSADRTEILPASLSTPEWQLRLRLPSFDAYTASAELKHYRRIAAELQAELEAERDNLQQELELANSSTHELRRYVLQLCDSLDPSTCKPYAGQRPTILVLPPPPLDAAPLP